LPVAAYCAAKPAAASIARRPFLSSFNRSSFVLVSDSLCVGSGVCVCVGSVRVGAGVGLRRAGGGEF
jgi:hypothetical protein